MTREEVTNVLKKLQGMYRVNTYVVESIDMAIEALQAQPAHGRLIDADFEEQHYASMLLNPSPDVTAKNKEDARIILGALKMAKTVSAEAVQGWIPVEEQPPVFPCLVCDANGNQPSVPLGIVTITDEEHGEWHIDGRLWDTKIFFKGEWCSQTGYGNRIIAWMPLPTPYKGGDSE